MSERPPYKVGKTFLARFTVLPVIASVIFLFIIGGLAISPSFLLKESDHPIFYSRWGPTILKGFTLGVAVCILLIVYLHRIEITLKEIIVHGVLSGFPVRFLFFYVGVGSPLLYTALYYASNMAFIFYSILILYLSGLIVLMLTGAFKEMHFDLNSADIEISEFSPDKKKSLIINDREIPVDAAFSKKIFMEKYRERKDYKKPKPSPTFYVR